MVKLEELVFGGETAVYIIYVLTGIYGIILTPLCIYYSYKLWKFSKAKISFFTKRHSHIVIYNVLAFNFCTYVRSITNVYELKDDTYLNNPIFIGLGQTVQIPVVFVCVRLWLLYYDYTLGVQIMDSKWKAEIVKEDIRKPWTIRYRWAGNEKIVSVIGCVFAGIVLSIIVTLPQYTLYTQTSPVLYLIFIIIMVIKIAKYRDQFYIRNEFVVFVWWIMGCFIVYIFIFIFVKRDTTLRMVIMNLYTALLSYALCFISTWWIIRKYQKKKKAAVLQRQRSAKHLNISTLRDILCKKDEFELFANHLVTEFATENLAFIVELMQIKDGIISHKLLDVENVGSVIEIPSEVIKKVRRKNAKIRTLKDLKENMKYIINEYVARNAQHCINLAFGTRNRVLKEFDELEQLETKDNVEDLVERNLHIFTGTAEVKKEDKELTIKYALLMDGAMKEICNLMQHDTLLRFLSVHNETLAMMSVSSNTFTWNSITDSIRNSIRKSSDK